MLGRGGAGARSAMGTRRRWWGTASWPDPAGLPHQDPDGARALSAAAAGPTQVLPFGEVEAAYLAGKVLVIDDLLTPHALEAIYRSAALCGSPPPAAAGLANGWRARAATPLRPPYGSTRRMPATLARHYPRARTVFHARPIPVLSP